MSYIDAVLIPVPTAGKAAYLAKIHEFCAVFLDNGALEVVDCWGDDVPEGKLTSFPMAVVRTDEETVALGWIRWPSKSVRDAAWEKAMQDPRMGPPETMPFDAGRMIFGGFELLNHARREA